LLLEQVKIDQLRPRSDGHPNEAIVLAIMAMSRSLGLW
jgi:hypothetical protein